MIKRLMDIVFASIGLIVLSPLLLTIFILVRIKLGSPAIFTQKRPGLNSKLFTFYKFRSMLDTRNKNDQLMDDEHRMTQLGSFLRRTSLDELPSLFNLLIGDLSLVGPRPLLEEYLELYSSEQARRHDVKPGITGWAQINGRNLVSWHEKFKFDIWYVENQSFLLDIKILIITIWKVLKREGINAKDHHTMEKFRGNL